MGVINKKINELDNHIIELNKLRELCVNMGTDFEAVINEAQEIVKLASFLNSYKELDKEREKAVKETVMNYLNERNTYDSALMESLGYDFGERD